MVQRTAIELIALPDVPAIKPGDDLVSVIIAGLGRLGLEPADGDVIVLAQKIVSKAEDRFVDLASVKPSREAEMLALEVGKDARIVDVILSQSRRVVRHRQNVLIVEHRLGFVMANAGIDQSNIAPQDGRELVLLLPADPDGSADRLRQGLKARTGRDLGIVINDSFGRAWRSGTVGIAIGSAGVPALLDKRDAPDLFGRPLRVTVVAHADELAAAASLLMGQADEGRPIVVVRGALPTGAALPAAALVRSAEEDLFR
jgi:coenzyme F420-0:L-glutamate ligase / coenzyme F420-1:gamma-L-glutamate ligase